LLGASPGAGIHDDESAPTYPIEQLRACLEHGRSRLILHPDGFRAESILNDTYRALVDDVHGRQDERMRLEIVSTKRDETAEAVLQKRRFILEERERALQAAQKDSSAPRSRTMFIDVHDHDTGHIDPLLQFLTSRTNLLPNKAAEMPGPKQMVFEELVSQADIPLGIPHAGGRSRLHRHLH